MTNRLTVDDDKLAGFCRRHRIHKLSLFGSVFNSTAGAGSDIDLLVEVEPDGKPGLIALAAMEDELSDLLGGRRVDLRTAEDHSRYFREEVVRTAEVQYAIGWNGTNSVHERCHERGRPRAHLRPDWILPSTDLRVTQVTRELIDPPLVLGNATKPRLMRSSPAGFSTYR